MNLFLSYVFRSDVGALKGATFYKQCESSQESFRVASSAISRWLALNMNFGTLMSVVLCNDLQYKLTIQDELAHRGFVVKAMTIPKLCEFYLDLTSEDDPQPPTAVVFTRPVGGAAPAVVMLHIFEAVF
jgi:hypothetical protein